MAEAAKRFVWYELMSPDVDAAKAFYSDVVGWAITDSGMPGMDYLMLNVGDQAIGGMMGLDDDSSTAGAQPGWIGYVAVDDVDASAKKVLQAGGAVLVEPQDIPGVGRFANVTDPHGAVLALFKGNLDEEPPSPAPGTPGTVGWHELYADKLDSAWAFYAELFGWTKDEAIDMGPQGSYQLFATGDSAVGGMMARPPDRPVAFWQYYFNVAEIDTAIERVKSGGGQVTNGPMQVPGGSWIINGLDPQGMAFALVAPKR